MALWVADGKRGVIRLGAGETKTLGPPGEALCVLNGRLFCAGCARCVCRGIRDGKALLDFPLPGGVCALCPLGGMVCALSSEADSLSAFSPETGQLLFTAPAGVYPRDLCLSPCGRYAAVAGGAAGEVLIFDGGLHCVRRHRLPGAPCAVCFLPRALAALCAVGDGELSARLMLISPRGVVEEVFACPQVPCSLCALSGGRYLVGCHGAVYHFRGDGQLTGRTPCAYPCRMRPLRQGGMICDACSGSVLSADGQPMYQGEEPWDAVVI